MTDPKLINSPLSRSVEENGDRVDVRIYRLEDTEWSLEIVASNGCSTVWDDLFGSDEAALFENKGASVARPIQPRDLQSGVNTARRAPTVAAHRYGVKLAAFSAQRNIVQFNGVE